MRCFCGGRRRFPKAQRNQSAAVVWRMGARNPLLPQYAPRSLSKVRGRMRGMKSPHEHHDRPSVSPSGAAMIPSGVTRAFATKAAMLKFVALGSPGVRRPPHCAEYPGRCLTKLLDRCPTSSNLGLIADLSLNCSARPWPRIMLIRQPPCAGQTRKAGGALRSARS